MSGSFDVPIQERDQVELKDAQQPTMNNPIDLPIKEDLGAGLNGVADSMAAQQLKIEKQQRIVAIHDIENKADGIVQAASEKVVGAEGENAFAVADQAQKEVKDQMSKLVSQAPGIYRPDYINVVNQRLNRFDKVSQGHQYRQANILADGVYKENASNLTDRMAMSPYGAPGEFDDNLNQLGIVTRQYMQHKMGGEGGNDSSPAVQRAVDVQVKTAQSLAVFKTIDALASTKDMANAEAYANKYSEYLTTGDRIKVNGILSKGRDVEKVSKALSLVDEAAQSSDDPTARRDYIQHAFETNQIDGTTYQHALNALTQRTNFDKGQKTIQNQKFLGEAYKEMASNGGNVTEEMYKKIDKQYWPTLNKYAVYTSEGKQVPLDSKFYAKKSDELDHMSQEQARKEDPASWDAHMPPEYKKRLESKRNAVINNNSSSRDVSDIANNFIKSEITAKGGSKKQKEMLTAEFKTLSDDVYEQVNNSLDPKASKDEKRQAYQNLMAAKMAPKDGHSWWDKTINRMQDHLSDLHHTEASTIFQAPEDQAIVNNVRQALKAQGKDTSDKNVFRYTRDIKNGIATDIPVVGQSNMVNSPFIAPSKKVMMPTPAPQTAGTRGPQSSGDPEVDKAFEFTTAQGKDDFKAFPYQVKYPDGTLGKQTIGYGHEVLPGEKFRYPMPESQARDIAYKDLKKAKTSVERVLKVPVTPEEKTVLTDMAFNLGPSHKSFLNTIQLFNQGKRKEAHENISKIDTSSHGDMGGLSNRAQDRINHILKGMKTQKAADGVDSESL